MVDAVLKTKDLKKSYGATVSVEVLHGIDLQLERGSFTSLIGPSGSGKTTLLNLMGLLDQPTSGNLFLDGIQTSGLPDNEIARLRNQSLGFIFQFHHLLPQFSVLENILIPHWIATGQQSLKMQSRGESLLNRVGLSHQAHQKAGALSGGQQQRVAIARALINSPHLVLADEPTGNLDTENTESVFTLLRQINREDGTAFLIVTHDRHIAAKSDRVVELVDGMIVRDQPLSGGDEDWKSLAPHYCKQCGLNVMSPLR